MAASYPDHCRLLAEFESLFAGQRYLHRNQTLGNRVAVAFYDDLYSLGYSDLFRARVDSGRCGVNVDAKVVGRATRRGDGQYGELVPGAASSQHDGSALRRGPVASVQIGAETKILAKAMIKQIDRVIGDLQRQVTQFQASGQQAIAVAFVGINHADHYISYEGARSFATDGSQSYRHPCQEAAKAEVRIMEARPAFDEFLVMPFRATNEPDYPFAWVDAAKLTAEYLAVLSRVSRVYEERFR